MIADYMILDFRSIRSVHHHGLRKSNAVNPTDFNNHVIM